MWLTISYQLIQVCMLNKNLFIFSFKNYWKYVFQMQKSEYQTVDETQYETPCFRASSGSKLFSKVRKSLQKLQLVDRGLDSTFWFVSILKCSMKLWVDFNWLETVWKACRNFIAKLKGQLRRFFLLQILKPYA